MSFGGFIRRTIFWTNDFFHGRRIRKYYDDLNKVHKNFESGSVIQQKHLEKLLLYAKENSAFYRDGFSDAVMLRDFPVMNKVLISRNMDKIRVPRNLIPGQVGEIHIQKTSGSTGTPFAIPQDTEKRYRRIAELKYYNEEVGVKSHEKIAQCRIWTKWQSKSKGQSFRENIIPVNVARMDDETVGRLLKIVKKEKVVLCRAYASWYDSIVQYLEKGKGDPSDLKSLKVCLSSSEALNEETRRKMLEMAGVPIVEAYASEEAGVLAQQRINDTNYYLNHSGYVFEFLKLEEDIPAESGEISRIVITDLFNYACPLIRYDTGDTAIFHAGDKNSNGWAYISKLYGRRLDLIYDENGTPIHPMNFARVLKNISGIIQWQFIQKGENEYLLKINEEKGGLDIDKAVFEIKQIVGKDSKIAVEYVDEIPVLASGKRKSVINEWKKY